jgi:hypothetical protein
MSEKPNELRRQWLRDLVAEYEVQFTEKMIYRAMAEMLIPNHSEIFENMRSDPPAELVSKVRELFDPLYTAALQDEGEEALLQHLRRLPTHGNPN